ncbi:MAG: MATE family efflux transporter [Gammaproteobacteria bacterium]|nr:MATE family efflux transporter [Gammaproteobacteria bacterium]MBT8109529.1 MATE family efflux transporter [Gammaproteobacteria bacterium]NND46122.1 MATE family efflux transporter [Woeseiaceae bacterium]NNL44231.1 MATE family efflux transporter [Woeseiaceae bacterium]
MILSNVSVPLLGMVDTGVTGHLDSPVYLGAVAIGAMIFSFLYTGMNFLRMGTTGITAQSFGADDNDGLRVSLGQAIIVALVVALGLILLQRPLGNLAMHLLGPDAETRAYAIEYFSIRIWSAPGTLANFALIGWFIGLQNARIPLLIFLTINITNIVLDLIFVLVFGMKVDGVALASVFAEYSGLVVGGAFALSTLRKRTGRWPVDRLVNVSAYKAFFSVNANLFIRTMALIFTLGFVTAQGARLGGLILAANAVLMNFQNLTSFGLDGLAHAAEAMVGKAIGQKRRNALQQAVRLTLRWSLIFSLGFTLVYFVAGPLIIGILTDLPDVRATAVRYLPWMVASPLISVWCFLYDGVYVGATRAKEMRNIMLVSTLVVFLPAWYLLQPLGNDGLWLAFLIFMASRGIGMHIGYSRTVLPMVSLDHEQR